MSASNRRAADKASTVLLASALVTNYAAHRLGRGTICSNMRPVFRTNTRAGKIVATTAWLTLTAWFIPHFVNGDTGFTTPPERLAR